MSRLLAMSLLLLGGLQTLAADSAPEKLLSPTATQVYIRWDGITTHQAAYKGSAWGGIMAGPTGKNLKSFIDRLPEFFAQGLLGEPVLEGQPLEQLRKVQADLKLVSQIPGLLIDRGLLLALEIREPRPSVAGLIKAVGAAVKGEPKAVNPAQALMPDVRFFLIVPNVGDKVEALYAPNRLINRSSGMAVAKPLPKEVDAPGFLWANDEGSPLQLAEWVIDGHHVEYIGTAPPAEAIAAMRANAREGGLTGNPLFKRAVGIDGFESVARGFVDTGAAIGLVKKLAGPLVPGLRERLDDLGASNLQSIVFSTGFAGKEAKAVYEIALPGERKGLAKILKREPIALKDLPPLPKDCSRFSALRIDWPAAYDAGLNFADAVTFNIDLGVESDKKTLAERIEARRAFLASELDKLVGLSVKDDLLPHLGDRFVMYQSPSEGLQVFGQCFAISCKNPKAVKAAIDRMQRASETYFGRTLVRKRIYAGHEMRELSSREFGAITPSYAVVGDWLIMAGNPQLVQGFILRHTGQADVWQPNAATTARFGKFASGHLGLQYCNPNSTAQNVCCVAPLFLATFTRFRFDRDNLDFADAGVLPNAHELGKHLFPNLAATYDDGKTLRIEVNESLSLPLDFIGFDPFLFAIATALASF